MNELTVDVVQTVVRARGKYLIGKRTEDGYWEFLGGKLEEGEDLKETALRELREETGKDLSEDITRYREGKRYRSHDNPKYRLNPVLIELEERFEPELSREHSETRWINLKEYHRFETLGQYHGLKGLGIIEGEVAVALPRENGKYLVLRRSEKTSSTGKWNFPGGKKKKDENWSEAALRELKEETGLTGEIEREGSGYIGKGELGRWFIRPYLVNVSGEAKLNHEHDMKKWLRPEKLSELETLGTEKALQDLDVEKR